MSFLPSFLGGSVDEEDGKDADEADVHAREDVSDPFFELEHGAPHHQPQNHEEAGCGQDELAEGLQLPLRAQIE